jgi:hypothetical protein
MAWSRSEPALANCRLPISRNLSLSFVTYAAALIAATMRLEKRPPRGLMASQLLMQDPSKPVVPFPLWIGACLAGDALITGNIHWSRSFTLSRANSPITFWLFVLFAMAVAIFGTRWEIRNRDAFWEDGEIVRRKIFLSIGLFFFLLLVYASFLFNFFAGGIVPDPLANTGLFLKPCLTAALPFAVLAYADKHWTSNDAAPVCAGGWVAACALLVHKHPMCALGLGFIFLPFVAATLIAHGVGTLASSLKQRAQSLHGEFPGQGN